MKKTIMFLMCAVFAGSLLLESPLADAKKAAQGEGAPAGFNQGTKKGWKTKKTPAGWEQGEKTGWQGAEIAPGIAKKSVVVPPPIVPVVARKVAPTQTIVSTPTKTVASPPASTHQNQ